MNDKRMLLECTSCREWYSPHPDKGHVCTKLMGAGPKDWTEDFSQENGNYRNDCVKCNSLFTGNKHRMFCKECYLENMAMVEKAYSDAEIKIVKVEYGWNVIHGDKYADGLGWDEMLGLVAALTMPESKPMLGWLKTEAEHKAWRDRIKTNKVVG